MVGRGDTGGIHHSFHSFEVGFGHADPESSKPLTSSFHSFEVGFGLISASRSRNSRSSFHSFEVGFGQDEVTKKEYEDVLFSFLRGRLRTG